MHSDIENQTIYLDHYLVFKSKDNFFIIQMRIKI